MNRNALFLALLAISGVTQASAWTYRGTLADGGKPANGQYDLRLTLVDETGTRSIAQAITLFNVPVRDGNFAADVDFGLDLSHAPAMKLKTEVAQGGSAFVSLGAPTRFDPKATLAGMCWDTTGNVVVAGEFIGSTNNMPVEIKANNVRVARFTGGSGGNNMVNVLLGSSANTINGTGATIGGGGSSAMTCGSGSSTCSNYTDETFATISGGAGNAIVGTTSTIGGGIDNVISGTYATIGGGSKNNINSTGGFGTIAGGNGNSVIGQYGAVSGGDGIVASGTWSVAAGGQFNEASGDHSVVGGGGNNRASGSASAIAGGLFNRATGERSTTAGGESGTASGTYSFVAGGYFNCAGGRASFAGGHRAKVRPGTNSGDAGEGCGDVTASDRADGDAGSFVWADVQAANFVSSGTNQFLVRADGGVMFNTNTLPNPGDDFVLKARAVGGDSDADFTLQTRNNKRGRVYLNDANGGFVWDTFNLSAGSAYFSMSNGASLSNGGVWTNASSRVLKEGFTAVQPMEILDKLAAMPISTWTYKQSAEGVHMGPMAEDFKATFGLAGDGKSISTVDADGVALAAIQGLNQKLETENAALRAEMAALRQAVQLLQKTSN